jgi:hypothetical protein
MVARTTISDGYRARAHAIIALARSWRPQEVMPGARSWQDAQVAAQGALAGLRGHLAIEPPPDDQSTQADGQASQPPGPLPGGHRLRLAVAVAARDGDQEATAALVGEGVRQGLDAGQLVAVAQAHWPKPRLHVRAWRAGRRWTAARARWLHRSQGRTGVLAEREGQP